MGEIIKMVFTKDELARIQVANDSEISVDVHGLDRAHCKKFLRNLINVNRKGAVIRVIHGYNNGTRLRDMIRYDNVISRRITGYETNEQNAGVTYLQVAGM